MGRVKFLGPLLKTLLFLSLTGCFGLQVYKEITKFFSSQVTQEEIVSLNCGFKNRFEEKMIKINCVKIRKGSRKKEGEEEDDDKES